MLHHKSSCNIYQPTDGEHIGKRALYNAGPKSPHAVAVRLYRKIHYSAPDFEARVVESSNFTMATEVANYRLAMAVDVL